MQGAPAAVGVSTKAYAILSGHAISLKFNSSLLLREGGEERGTLAENSLFLQRSSAFCPFKSSCFLPPSSSSFSILVDKSPNIIGAKSCHFLPSSFEVASLYTSAKDLARLHKSAVITKCDKSHGMEKELFEGTRHTKTTTR